MPRTKMTKNSIGPEKQSAFAYLDRNAKQIALLSDNLFWFGEPSLQEYESAKLLVDVLEHAGFNIEKGISGFETGFLATWGDGEPVIALHAEYDALPENSQEPGILEKRPIIEGAPGHCEGHHANAAVMVASALALKHVMEDHGIKGTLKVFGAPAEELALSRPYFVRDGYFDDVDLAFHNHIGTDFHTEYDVVQIGCLAADFTFHGETAHAGLAPWRGRDALDAVVLMDVGLAQFREHMEPMMRAHRVITHGGIQPNIIPDMASVWWMFRHPEAVGVKALFDQAKNIAEGAALMTKTRLEVNVRSAVWPLRCNQTMADVMQRSIEAVGMPEWSDEEQAFARDVQTAAGEPMEGLPESVTPLTGPGPMIGASNDCGDISWKVPMGRVWFPGSVPGVSFHNWTAGIPLTSSITHKGALAGAKALTSATLDFFMEQALVDEAKRTFHEELGGIAYEPMLPPDQKPDLTVNKELMERFRDPMQASYLSEKPEFV